MIKLILSDIDGVLTDGKITVDSAGKQYKTFDLKDIDAVFEMKRRGYKIGLITGEGTPITLFFKERFQPDFFYNDCKSKPEALERILLASGLSAREVCYCGDGKHDIPIMKLIENSACPSNAIPEVKDAAKIHLESRGGDGCLWELMNWVLEYNNEA